jgi:hypothetical protein
MSSGSSPSSSTYPSSKRSRRLTGHGPYFGTVRQEHDSDSLFSPVVGWLIMAGASVAVAALVLLASLWHLHQAPVAESSTIRKVRTLDADFRAAVRAIAPQLGEGGALELGSDSALRRLVVTANALHDYAAKSSKLFASESEIAQLRAYLGSLEPELSALVGPGLAQRDGEAAIREIFESCNRRVRASPTWAERVAAQDVVALIKRLPESAISTTQLEWSKMATESRRLQQAREALEAIRSRPALGDSFCVAKPQLVRLASAGDAGLSADRLREAAAARLSTPPPLPALVPPNVWERLQVRGAFPHGFLLVAAVLLVGVFSVLMLLLRIRSLRRAVAEDRADVSASLSSMGRFAEDSLGEIRERLLTASAKVEALQEKIKAYGLVSWDLSAAGALARTQAPLSNDAIQLQELAALLHEDFHGGEDNERVGYRISELIAATDALRTSVRTFEKSLSMFREASVSRESAQRDEIDRWRYELEALLVVLRNDAKLLSDRLDSLAARRT